MTRIALFADEPMSAAGFRAAISQAGGFELIAVWSTLADLAAIAFQNHVDIILVGMPMEETAEVLKEMAPHMADRSFVLWVRDLSNEAKFQAMALGVRGIIRKTLPIEQQVEALRKVASGELYFDESITAGFIQARRVDLVEREIELATLVAQGLTNKEIGAKLGYAEGSIKAFLLPLFKKVGVTNRHQLKDSVLRTLADLPPDEKLRFISLR